MAKSLDFNSLQRPTLEITLSDPERTALRVTTPEEELIRKLLAAAKEIESLKDAQNLEAIQACYDLAAALMSHNMEGLQITGEDLRKKYRVGIDHLIIFMSVYLDFIQDIENAKN